MKPIDVANLSDKAVKLLLGDCESKIKHCEADLDDYELFVKCQRELLKRQSRKEVSERHYLFA
jgi:hypothetical protein